MGTQLIVFQRMRCDFKKLGRKAVQVAELCGRRHPERGDKRGYTCTQPSLTCQKDGVNRWEACTVVQFTDSVPTA